MEKKENINEFGGDGKMVGGEWSGSRRNAASNFESQVGKTEKEEEGDEGESWRKGGGSKIAN